MMSLASNAPPTHVKRTANAPETLFEGTSNAPQTLTRLRDTPPRHSVDQNPIFLYVENTVRREISGEKPSKILPRACRPSTKLKKTMSKKWTPTKSNTQQSRKSGPSKSWKKQCRKSGFIYAYIPSYTFMYLYIPPNSFIYVHISPHTSKYWILGK